MRLNYYLIVIVSRETSYKPVVLQPFQRSVVLLCFTHGAKTSCADVQVLGIIRIILGMFHVKQCCVEQEFEPCGELNTSSQSLGFHLNFIGWPIKLCTFFT